jgi:hypothetical protein
LICLASLYFLSFDAHVSLLWKQLTSYQSRLSARKNAIKNYLENSPLKDVVFVQYSPGHSVDAEWVYNSPEIDAQKIIWAHDLGDKEDQRLINYYPDRNIWRVIVSASQPNVLQRWNNSSGKFEFVKSFTGAESDNPLP